LTNIAIPTVTTSVAQGANLYPLDLVSVSLASNATLVGAEIRIYDMDNNPVGSLGSELAGFESNVGSVFTFQAEAGNTVWVQVQKTDFEEYGSEYVVPAADSTLPVFLTAELNT
jgi:hypothetical protein